MMDTKPACLAVAAGFRLSVSAGWLVGTGIETWTGSVELGIGYV